MKEFSIENRKILLDGVESGTGFTPELEEDTASGTHDAGILISSIVDMFIEDMCERNDLCDDEIAAGKLFLTNYFTK